MEDRRRANHERNRRDVIVLAWAEAGRPPVGEKVLRSIQKKIHRQVGNEAMLSPAAIARLLADEGAILIHPEVIEFDARWREKQLATQASKLRFLEPLIGDVLELKQTASVIQELEKIRRQAQLDSDAGTLREIKEIVVEAREVASRRSKDASLAKLQRAEQVEIAEWLRVWLQTPTLFEQWLDLRRSSPDFKKKFPDQD